MESQRAACPKSSFKKIILGFAGQDTSHGSGYPDIASKVRLPGIEIPVFGGFKEF